ncbi:hypothetical protein [Priestia endophytica]|uniref:hypothetical protein n=1 Tax=Priestia endophytica TaxID=135735 RepID=UPI000DCA74A9|nr:hypothetical protein [Priestia endophytica]RAS77477.1 hypothetical protein A4U60_17850 [Priestia endophytica]
MSKGKWIKGAAILLSTTLLVSTLSVSASSAAVKYNSSVSDQSSTDTPALNEKEAQELEKKLQESGITSEADKESIVEEVKKELEAEGIVVPGSPSQSQNNQGTITTFSKGSVSVKAISNAIEKHQKPIDRGIKGAVNKLPLPKATKARVISALSVGGLLKAISHYTGFVDSVEDFLSGIISDRTGLGKTPSDIIAKTITLFLPL